MVLTLLRESGLEHSGFTVRQRSLPVQPIGSSETARINRDCAATNNRHDRQPRITLPTSIDEPNTSLSVRARQSYLK
jgi:hypothetical protein